MTQRLDRRVSQLSREERAIIFERLRNQKAGGGTGAPGAPGASGAPGGHRIQRRPPDAGPAPLSYSQQRLWFIDLLAPGDPAYNVATAIRITGPLDPAALRRALDSVAARHESLRTTFQQTDAGPVQVVAPEVRSELPMIDLEGIAAIDRERALDLLHGLCSAESRRAFDLATGPLLRATLSRFSPEEHVLTLVMHHIVSDGWSLGILIQEVTAFYHSASPPLPELPIQYPDFAAWQREHLRGAVLEEQLRYWRERLAGAPPALDLPTDRPRPALRSTNGTSRFFLLPAGPAKALGMEHGSTLFIVLLAAFQAVLRRWTGQTDLSVGTAVANRTRAEISGLIGFFINSLVLRSDLSGDPTFLDLLVQVRETALGAYAHQDVPFEKLVEELRPERDPSRSPLFQVMLILQNTPAPRIQLGEMRLEPFSFDAGTSKLDLTLSLEEHEDMLGSSLNYNTDLFEAATAARLIGHFERLFAAACANPRRRISELPMLSPGELAQVLREWDDGSYEAGEPTPLLASPRTHPSSRPGRRDFALVPERFERQAELAPDRPALVFDDLALTYAELRERVQKLAGFLRARGVGPEVRVALALERSPEMVVSLMAVLAAGGAYVPLDPHLPEARLATLLEESGAALALLRDSGLAGALDRAGVPWIDLGADQENQAGGHTLPPILPESAAYVLFTSGSTGRPKGVVVEHRQLAHYIAAVEERLRVPSGAGFALASTFTADLGNTVLFPSLCSGGCLHVLSRERSLDPEAFADYAERHELDVLKIVPSHLTSLLKGTRPETVLPRQVLVLGGEAATWELVDRVADLAPGCRVLNHYGPTEATVGVTTQELGPDGQGSSRPALGRPLARTWVRLLGRSGELVPIGAPGEIHLGGAGVARGYLGRPDLTAERFVPDPFAAHPGARLYRTGDLGRRLRDGRLEFLGRTDDQVKVRGYRVEPREVEAALAALPGVARCAVLARPEAAGGAALAAYIEASPGAGLTAEKLRDSLVQSLPGYMVPSAFAILDSLPLTPNGKLDRQRLSGIDPVPGIPAPGATFTAPRTEVERAIAAIWTEVLGLERVGLQDNFFDLGGHSLLLTQAQKRLRETLGRDVPLLKFFEFPTVGTLAAHLEGGGEGTLVSAGSRDRAQRQRQGLGLQRQRLAGRARG